MAVLRWVAIVVLAAVGGFLGLQLTGTWLAVPVGAIAMAFATDKVFAGEWVISLITLVVAVVVLFQFIGRGRPPEVAKTGNKAQAANDSAAEKSEPGLLAQITETVVGQATEVKKALGLDSGNDAGAGSGAGAVKSAGGVFKDCATCPELVRVPAGTFLMGSAAGQGAPDGRESPQHKVTVRGFAAGRFAVTRGQFAEFVKATSYKTDAERNGGCFALQASGWGIEPQGSWRKPGFQQADDHPAVCISWNDTQAYVAWLNATTRQKYRLLTEAEREYATRAGSTTAYWWGDTLTPQQAHYNADPGALRRATVPVNQFAANPMGLYNVHGNAAEWVQDCQHDNYDSAPSDGSAWSQKCVGTKRMVRGGGWVSDAAGLRSAARAGFAGELALHAGGFRVARD